MTELTEITKGDALEILQEYGSQNDAEKRWSQDYLAYQVEHGRTFFYKGILEKDEFMGLTFNEQSHPEKVQDFKNSLRQQGYRSNSYLCLRDLEANEHGSFYVDNGKHRVAALQALLNAGDVSFPKIPAVVVCKSKLSTAQKYVGLSKLLRSSINDRGIESS